MKVSSVASFAVGVQMLRTNPLRTVLSTLGIIIGVAALVAILALGDGLEQFARRQVEQTTDLHVISVLPRTSSVIDGVSIRLDSVTRPDIADATQLSSYLAGRADATLILAASVFAGVPGDTTRHAAVVTGFAPAASAGAPDTVLAGRALVAEDTARRPGVVLLGSRLAELIATRPESLIGADVILGEHTRTVVGIIDGRAARRIARAYIPLGDSAPDILGGPGRIPSLIVRVHTIEDVPAVETDVRRWLDDRYGDAERKFSVVSSQSRVEDVRQAILVFKLALGAITGIAILVGGIGIMNVLLASVQERTREIGVRRAAGAHQRDIFLQFLAESVAVSGIGSILGVVLGLGAAFGITAVIRSLTDAPLHPAFTWTTLAAAAAAALFVGVAFGSYPASHAARLSPIDAIRHE